MSDDISTGYMQRRSEGVADGDWAAIDAFVAEQSAASPAPAAPAEAAPAKAEGEESTTAKVVKDVAKGATEVPRAIAHGAVDAFNEVADLAGSFGQWVEDKVGLGGFSVGADGVSLLSADELAAKRAAGEGLADQRLPNVDAPESVTGGVVEGVAQFITGFGAAGKAMKGVKAATTAGKVGKAAAQGAATDFAVFDPHEARLSNLVEEYPALSNPVTSYLAADENDGEAEGRFKNAVEGLIPGVAVDGMVQGLRVLRKAREAKIAATKLPEVETATPDFGLLGDTQADELMVPKKAPVDPADAKLKAGAKKTKGTKPEDVAGKPAAAEAPEDAEVMINWARINTEDDVKTVMQTVADMHVQDITSAQRGVRSWKTTRLSAQQKNAWDILSKRRNGEPLNAEQTYAARELWATSGTKLKDIAEAAATAPNETNLVMFRKMLATHYAIQREVLAARTETARALNAWAIPAGEGKVAAKQLADMLEQNGGLEVSQDLARRVAALANAGMFHELDKVIEKGVWAKTKDAVAQAWVNGLLTNPATHVVNAMSNWSVAALTVGERAAASRLSRLMGAENGVEVGEAVYLMFGMTQGIRDALRISAKGLKVAAASGKALVAGDAAGAKQMLTDNAQEFGSVYRSAATGKAGFGMEKLDGKTAGGSFSAETWNIASDTWLGRGLDVLDTATSAPGRALTVSDEFFKTMGYRMELNARALRQATQEVRDGALPKEGLKKRITEILDNPPEDIKLAAIDAASYQTFTNAPAEVLKKLADGIQQVPILGRMLLPFKNTPINVTTFAFERTPLAPLVASWRADIAAGGARADLAMARTAGGTMVMLGAMDLAMSGVITGGGPTEPGKKQQFNRTGRQKYSVKVDDTWYSYSRADPVGMTIGLAADIVELAQNADLSQEDTAKIIQAATLSIAKNITSKTYMEGVSNFFDAVSDPDRYGATWFQQLAGSVVPSGVAAVARMEDPYMRTAAGMVDAMKRRVPGLSEGLPQYRDLWGRPVDYRSGEGAMYDLFSPVYIKRENPEPIDTELGRLEYYPAMPQKTFSFSGVKIDLREQPEAFSRYVELAGNEVKDPAFGMGAKDYLNAIVTGKHPLSPVYEMMDDEKKESFIEGKLADYRKSARQQLMQEFPALQAQYDQKRQNAAIGLP